MSGGIDRSGKLVFPKFVSCFWEKHQPDRQAGRPTDRLPTNRPTVQPIRRAPVHRPAGRLGAGRVTDRQTDRPTTGRPADRLVGRPAGRSAGRHNHNRGKNDPNSNRNSSCSSKSSSSSNSNSNSRSNSRSNSNKNNILPVTCARKSCRRFTFKKMVSDSKQNSSDLFVCFFRSVRARNPYPPTVLISLSCRVDRSVSTHRSCISRVYIPSPLIRWD